MDSNELNISNEPAQHGKRRSNPKLWKNNKRKISIVKGAEYVTVKGKEKPAKETGMSCR